ncbi:FAD:protein FMN transferase [Prosthecobacter fluviatilis]|uniref:FAD:protein FMN transferase n=1 Tax=Prosthecobacter fluviatilis TaxID=445931 RepID=A0ABW0KTJ7_9BACT
MSPPAPQHHRFTCNAMATTFDVLINHEDADDTYAAQAAQAVFQEIARLEDELSRFRATSDIYRLGQLKAGESIRVGMAAWDCLSLAKAMHQETAGAFDITIGPLMHLFVTPEGEPRQVNKETLEQARQIIGSQRFDLDEETMSVTVHAAGMIFDLGAMGKGYALDQAADVLQDWKISNFILNAGDSTILGIGAPSGKEAWSITLGGGDKRTALLNRAVSGSGFAVKGAHIMNPRLFQPVPLKNRRTYALAPTAALSDALSTAFMVMEQEEIEALCSRYAGVEALALEM